MSKPELRVAIAGLGYFSQFHLSAWAAQPDVQLVGACDPTARPELPCPCYDTLPALLAATQPDLIDIVAPPAAHAELIRASLADGRWIICQKPFARDLNEAQTLTKMAEAANTCLVIHENFRFQPWYRALKDFLASGQMGQVYQARFALRPGDGRGAEAYLARQPAFQTMPRLLIHETGVHFIDLFRWLFGDVTSVYADLTRLNPHIKGEDSGVLIMDHVTGTRSIFDGNRLSDHIAENPRKTMGDLQVEGEGGTVTLDGTGALWFRPFGTQSVQAISNPYPVDDASFGGGCVAALIDHVAHAWQTGQTPDNVAGTYLDVVRASAAAYRSADTGQKIQL